MLDHTPRGFAALIDQIVALRGRCATQRQHAGLRVAPLLRDLYRLHADQAHEIGRYLSRHGAMSPPLAQADAVAGTEHPEPGDPATFGLIETEVVLVRTLEDAVSRTEADPALRAILARHLTALVSGLHRLRVVLDTAAAPRADPVTSAATF
jgi:hypothetical protein